MYATIAHTEAIWSSYNVKLQTELSRCHKGHRRLAVLISRPGCRYVSSIIWFATSLHRGHREWWSQNKYWQAVQEKWNSAGPHTFCSDPMLKSGYLGKTSHGQTVSGCNCETFVLGSLRRSKLFQTVPLGAMHHIFVYSFAQQTLVYHIPANSNSPCLYRLKRITISKQVLIQTHSSHDIVWISFDYDNINTNNVTNDIKHFHAKPRHAFYIFDNIANRLGGQQACPWILTAIAYTAASEVIPNLIGWQTRHSCVPQWYHTHGTTVSFCWDRGGGLSQSVPDIVYPLNCTRF